VPGTLVGCLSGIARPAMVLGRHRTKVMGIELDTDASLLPESEQRIWLENQICGARSRGSLRVDGLAPSARGRRAVDQGDQPQPAPERTCAGRLSESVAPQSAARFVVSAGHIHNYERFDQDGVVYLVSGGGGARPYEVDRTPADQYQSADFPNYHYVRFELQGDRWSAK